MSYLPQPADEVGRQTNRIIQGELARLRQVADAGKRAAMMLSTGLLDGGALSATVGGTSFTVAAGAGQIVQVGAYDVRVDAVTWAGGTYPLATPSAGATWVLVDATGAVVQQNTEPTAQDRAEKVLLGMIRHAQGTVEEAISAPDRAVRSVDAVADVVRALGPVAKGVVVVAGSGLGIGITAGSLFGVGLGDVGSEVVIPAMAAPVTLDRRTRDGDGATGVTALDPASWDNGGTLDPVPAGKWTAQRVYVTAGGRVVVLYGQSLHDTKNAALQAARGEAFVLLPSLAGVAALVGVVLLRQDATSLTDPTKAGIYRVGDRGEVLAAMASGAGSGLDADLLDGLNSTSFFSTANLGIQVKYFGQGIHRYASASVLETVNGTQSTLEVFQPNAGEDAFMTFHVSSDFAAYFGLKGDINDFAVGGWSMGNNWYRVWHGGNDGAGSGLDADLLDGYHGDTANTANTYVRRDGSGNINVSGVAATSRSAFGTGTIDPKFTLTAAGTLSYPTSCAKLAVLGGATARRAEASFYGTFASGGDTVPRRAADIVGGFSTGVWGTEYLAFHVGNNGASNDAGNLTAEKMRITGSGLVGIGTTAPSEKLHVVGNARIQGQVNADSIPFGTYTPTVSSAAGCTVTYVSTFRWFRVGNLVLMWGSVDVDITSTTFYFELSIPVASNFTQGDHAFGPVNAQNKTNIAAYAYAATATDRVLVSGTASGTPISGVTLLHHVTYQVL